MRQLREKIMGKMVGKIVEKIVGKTVGKIMGGNLLGTRDIVWKCVEGAYDFTK